ncbi:MAG: baseplate J/gp47 family protein [Nitrospira sp.]
MPALVPNLDDRRFDDLVQEGMRILPLRAPTWTNHNTADPGITVLELFAYVTEALLYQTNRITERHRQQFLRMLVGCEAERATGGTSGQQIEEAVRGIDLGDRTVTAHDYVRLAMAAHSDVVKAECIVGMDLTGSVPIIQPNHVSVVIIPRSSEEKATPSAALIQRVQDELNQRRLLTTHVHVVPPQYVPVRIGLSVTVAAGTDKGEVSDEIAKVVQAFLDPVSGGPDGLGWPAGKALYASALVRQLHTLARVKYVDAEAIVLQIDHSRIRRGSEGEVLSLELGPAEYFTPEISRQTIEISYEASR